jgi:hypothetical protein
MTGPAILAASGLLVFAYVLDIVGRRFRLPSVVLLILTGLAMRRGLDAIDVDFKWVDPIVPIVGTLGLILIVLEGALDLTVTRERRPLIVRATTAALAGFAGGLVAFTALFRFLPGLSYADAALAAMTFAVISSAVAIPSAAGLADELREFVTFESALSDIVGVLVFYAWIGAGGSLAAFAATLFGGGAVSLVVAVAGAVAIFYLVNQVEGHVRYLPLLAGLIFLYALGKELHLSPLVLVLVCGLLLNNPHLIERSAWLRAVHGPDYDRTLGEFRGIVVELTFATKSFFFLLLGYWTDLSQMVSGPAWQLAGGIVLAIYAMRWAMLRAMRQPGVGQLMWIAPRGLITVLLMLTALDEGRLASFPFGTVMLVVLATSAATALAHHGGAAAEAVPEPPGEAQR